MTLVRLNPLHYPLIVALSAALLVIGTRIFFLPKTLMLVLAVALALVMTYVRNLRDAKNTPLQREINQIKQRSFKIVEQAHQLRQDAAKLLTRTEQMGLLTAIEYACDGIDGLPDEIAKSTDRLLDMSDLSLTADFELQLAEAKARLPESQGVAQTQLQKLISNLEENLELAKQGQANKEAQVYAIANQLVETVAVIQQLQTEIATKDLSELNNINQLSLLSDELTGFQQNLNLLIGNRAETTKG